jgi:hypothetical protein
MVVYIHRKKDYKQKCIVFNTKRKDLFVGKKKRLGKGEETLNFNPHIKMHTP